MTSGLRSFNAEAQRRKDAERKNHQRSKTHKDTMNEHTIGSIIVSAAVEAHRTLGGPGLLESVYEEALVWEILHRKIKVERQLDVPIKYKSFPLAHPLRLDLLVGGLVIVECKATMNYNSIYEAQVLTYLRLMNMKLGYVINFGEKLVKDGVHRVANGM
jgi:GxxExxY protein